MWSDSTETRAAGNNLPPRTLHNRALSIIARGRATTVQRALRGFDRDGNADQDEVSLARRGGWGLQSEMPAALWKQLTPHNHRVLAQMRMRWSLRLFTWWRATLSTMPWPPAAASFR